YTRFTLLTIVRCLLDYADSEFGRDTGESVARARALYDTARDLLDSDELAEQTAVCASIVGGVALPAEDRNAGAQLADVTRQLSNVSDVGRLTKAIDEINASLSGTAPVEQRLIAARQTASRAEALAATPVPLQEVLIAADQWRNNQYLSLTSAGAAQRVMQSVGQIAGAA